MIGIYCIINKINQKKYIGQSTEEEVKQIKLSTVRKKNKYEKRKEYSINKKGFNNGKQNYGLYNSNHKTIIQSINKDKLINILEKLNTGQLTEEEVKKQYSRKKKV